MASAKKLESNYGDRLLEFLRKSANPSEVAAMEAYMKNRFQFLGVKSVPRRDCLRDVIATNGLPDQKPDLIIRELWGSPYREVHYCAQELAFRMKVHRQHNSIGLIEWMVVNQSWWDTVDYIASTLAGGYFLQFPDQIPIVTNTWNASSNMWLQRSSLLFQLKYKSETDRELLERYIIPHLGSSEFFIQKAIGWALREYSKFNPEFVRGVVRTHPLKPVSKREATKYI